MKTANKISSVWSVLYPGTIAILVWLSWAIIENNKAGVSQEHIFDAIVWGLLHTEFGLLLLSALWIILSIVWLVVALFQVVDRRQERQTKDLWKMTLMGLTLIVLVIQIGRT
jgi:hypothetical protein